MEKISLLLLFAKKTLIGTVISGMLGLGSLTGVYTSDSNRNDENKTVEKKIIDNPRQQMPPARR